MLFRTLIFQFIEKLRKQKMSLREMLLSRNMLFGAAALCLVGTEWISHKAAWQSHPNEEETAKRCEEELLEGIAHIRYGTDDSDAVTAQVLDETLAALQKGQAISPLAATINKTFVANGGVRKMKAIDEKCRAYAENRLYQLPIGEPKTPIDYMLRTQVPSTKFSIEPL